MAYSHAAMQGVKDNGKKWRKTVRGLPALLEQIDELYNRKDVAGIDAAMRQIAVIFARVWDEGKASSGENEALEWFQEESCAYEFENGTEYEWREEFNFRLSELYDWADYCRVWVAPERN